MLRIVTIGLISIITLGSFLIRPVNAFPEKLSDWKIFSGKLSALTPANGVVPYAVNTPLYSDYAEKARFVKMPEGSWVNYQSSDVFDFPTGTLLIKVFYYSADFRKPGEAKKIMETRLLVKEAAEWKAITYVWNEEQTEAFLEIAGDDQQVSFIDKEGVAQQVRYVVPNQNQCKGCHNVNDRLVPIGPSASALNGTYPYTSGKDNQLVYWKKNNLLAHLPDLSAVPRTAVWNDPATGDINARARAYLAVNCAHCHRREGPAQTSGLFLTEKETDSTAIGFNKPPVAAGKGSGGRMVDILPGNAKGSILWYRMQTKDPGERMPELGRNLVHKEGLALVEEWINQMKK